MRPLSPAISPMNLLEELLSEGIELEGAASIIPADMVTLIEEHLDTVFGGESSSLNFGPAYLGIHDPANPLVSPLFADLHDLPPTLIHVGSDEILLDDSTRLEERLRAAGVDARLEIWEGMWHVFQIFAPYVPEAQQAIREIGNFISEQIV